MGSRLVYNQPGGNAAIGAVFARVGIFAHDAVLGKTPSTLIKHFIGYFFAASRAIAFFLFHSRFLLVFVFLLFYKGAGKK